MRRIASLMLGVALALQGCVEAQAVRGAGQDHTADLERLPE